MGIKGRIYSNDRKYKKAENIDEIIKTLEETGNLIGNISP